MFSTSTRNFPNRLGKNTNVYLGSAELAAICSQARAASRRAAEYMADMGVLDAASDQVYQYLNFDKIERLQRCRGEGRGLSPCQPGGTCRPCPVAQSPNWVTFAAQFRVCREPAVAAQSPISH